MNKLPLFYFFPSSPFASVSPNMLRRILATAAILCFFLQADGAVLRFDFAKTQVGSIPDGFISTIAGAGDAGVWKVVEDEIPSAFAPLSPNASTSSKRRVLAQTARDKTDEHFPILIYGKEVFGDFTLQTKFKCVDGELEKMAGVVFRYLNEKNFYVLRASAKGNTFRFYKVVDGQRAAPIGPEIQIPAGAWHEMSVTCKGNQIRCSLNGKEVIPMMTDNSFTAGKIGFWTKSDSVSFFADTQLDYTPRDPIAQKAVRTMMERFPKLLGLQIVAYDAAKVLKVIASNNETEIGQPGSETDKSVIDTDQVFTARGKDTITVYVPLRDRNGDTIGSLAVKMKSFTGQTENNALARTLPINKEISTRIQLAKDLLE